MNAIALTPKSAKAEIEEAFQNSPFKDEIEFADKNNKAFFIVGQPGAGKSAVVDDVRASEKGAFFVLNLDDIREFLYRKNPEYNLMDWNETASVMLDIMREYALEHGVNFISDQTGKTLSSLANFMRKAHDRGYSVTLIAMRTPFLLSLARSVRRFLNGVLHGSVPRMTPPDFQKKAWNGYLDTLRNLHGAPKEAHPERTAVTDGLARKKRTGGGTGVEYVEVPEGRLDMLFYLWETLGGTHDSEDLYRPDDQVVDIVSGDLPRLDRLYEEKKVDRKDMEQVHGVWLTLYEYGVRTMDGSNPMPGYEASTLGLSKEEARSMKWSGSLEETEQTQETGKEMNSWEHRL